uniref:Cytochrome P450 2k1c n=1 Tax=Lateolabrax maculatus TaxID=315492 RepID=A0A7T7FRN6_LATMC|nr:cytochrome P450 2k1c [Lateolabrax maculatus]
MENLFLELTSTTTVLGTVGILLALYVFFPSFDLQRKKPPGPRPLLWFGNLLQLDPKSPHTTLYELSKKYGPVFTFHFGPKKVVVLAGYKTIKQAMINQNAFSEREIFPIIKDLKLTHGKAFDTTRPVNYAVSNIICSIVYGHRFEYNDPEFSSAVDRANKNTQLLGCASVQLYNYFPRLFNWLGARKQLMKSALANRRHMTELIKGLQETLNPQMCRGLVDSFLAHKIHLEVHKK